MMTLGGLSLGIRETFSSQLPPGVEFYPPDGMLFLLAKTPAGMRYVAYLVKIETGEPISFRGIPVYPDAKIYYQGISLRLSEIASIDLVVGKVTDAITKFRQALLAGTARSTVDGGLMELDPEDEEVPLEADEAAGPRE